jgi:hypothetical protein
MSLSLLEGERDERKKGGKKSSRLLVLIPRASPTSPPWRPLPTVLSFETLSRDVSLAVSVSRWSRERGARRGENRSGEREEEQSKPPSKPKKKTKKLFLLLTLASCSAWTCSSRGAPSRSAVQLTKGAANDAAQRASPARAAARSGRDGGMTGRSEEEKTKEREFLKVNHSLIFSCLSLVRRERKHQSALSLALSLALFPG